MSKSCTICCGTGYWPVQYLTSQHLLCDDCAEERNWEGISDE